jgi:hypothetical protein
MEPWWFNTVASDYQLFQISGCQFLLLYAAHFRNITSGKWPNSAPDLEAFTPVLEKLNGFVWHLWCDRILTTATVMNQNYLESYLSMGVLAIHQGIGYHHWKP